MLMQGSLPHRRYYLYILHNPRCLPLCLCQFPTEDSQIIVKHLYFVIKPNIIKPLSCIQKFLTGFNREIQGVLNLPLITPVITFPYFL